MAPGHVTHARLKAFADCLHRIYGEPTGENPLDLIMDAIEELVPFGSLSVDLVNLTNASLSHVDGRYTEQLGNIDEIVPLLVEDHPMVHHTFKHGPSPVQRLSDFVTLRQLREISLYHYVLKLHQFQDQAAVLVTVPEGGLAFAINRDTLFEDEEILLLSLIQPHIQRVLGRCALFADFKTNGKLTPREREVLFWMTRGKRDEEIALILRLGVRTVNEHVRRILAKLNVENRTSAVAAVLGREAGDLWRTDETATAGGGDAA